ncbi:MAG: L,D-transpeptidase family protein [Magnetococcales bacterium]|nr:L,D-transpeptidase family protein [Magnetococcales bacterium]
MAQDGKFRVGKWLCVLALAMGVQGCTMTTARLNIGKAIHLPWETAEQVTAPSWSEETTTVKLEQSASKSAERKHRGVDPVGDILKEKSWDYSKVRWTVERYEYDVSRRVKEDFEAAGVSYPPSRLAMIALKKERKMELWAGDEMGAMRRVKNYPFTAFSGVLGPKQRAGDGQIPEGVYRITYLTPDSAYHLSMKLNYPNEFDRQMADRERRSNLGGDIFIHGDSRSIGCIALGNRAIEELFVLTALTGAENAKVIIAPYDMREDEEIRPMATIPWTRDLYANIQRSLLAYRGDTPRVVASARE